MIIEIGSIDLRPDERGLHAKDQKWSIGTDSKYGLTPCGRATGMRVT